jgi:pimeloyl-ACP methyl ester carboxylesterase
LSVVTIPTRPGVTETLLLKRREHAWATVLLFTGGNGFLGISPSGFVTEPSNFLVRSRDLFFAQGLNVAIVDPPSDRVAPDFLNGFRRSLAHAEDIQVVLQFLRENLHAPVWNVGTSNGTFSAASTAALLQDKGGPDGVVLTSSIVISSPPGAATLFSIDLAAITVPTLVVHHVQDGCFVTLFSGVPPLVAALANARNVTLVPEVGGGPTQGDPCQPWGFHGYPGIESRVVDQIADYMQRHQRLGEHGNGNERR